MQPSAHTDLLDSLRDGPPTPQAASAIHVRRGAMERLLCEVCGDVIGVYEPLVVRTSNSERTTSRAAEPELRARDGAYFHRECHSVAAG